MRCCVIVPTYNERETIIPLVKELFSYVSKEIRVLVVDDGSPDGTAELVRSYSKRNPRVELIERSRKLGMGSAYQMAFRMVLDEGVDEYIVTMDADFSHHPRYVPELMKVAKTNDLVVGSRYVRDGKIENWERWRRLLSWSGNWYVRMVTRSPLRDNTSGFSCMRSDFLRRLPFEEVKASGYAWWFALRTMFYRRGAKIKEIPIIFSDRRFGKSKLSTDIIYEGLIEPWRIRFSRFL